MSLSDDLGPFATIGSDDGKGKLSGGLTFH